MNTDALVLLLEYGLLVMDDNVDAECEYFSNNKSSASGCCLAFANFLPISAWRCL